MRTFYVDAGCWLGSSGNVVLAIWGPEPTVARIIKSQENTRAVVEANPNGVVSFSLIPQLGSKIPKLGADERKIINEIVKEFASRTLATVNVVEGSGFWVSTARAILAGIAMLSRSPTKTVDSNLEGATWLAATGHATLGGGSRNPSAIVDAIEAARTDWSRVAKA